MKYLLSLPPNLADQFNQLEDKPVESWFSTSDPPESKLGSGGGTVHLLNAAWQQFGGAQGGFFDWVKEERSLMIHAGGQSRRLPGYAPSGKILTPIPVLRWARGQRLQQHLLDLQMPLLEEIMDQAPNSYRSLIASGDVLVRATGELPQMPEVDVLCMGIWMSPERVSHHGVYFMNRQSPETLAFTLQKPRIATLREKARDYLFMIDVGIWLLSEKALKVLMKKCGWQDGERQFVNGVPDYYDLYSDFGQSLGSDPEVLDPEVQELTSAVVPLPAGEFYHFGRSRELIESSLALQNQTQDQRRIFHRYIKPSQDIFVLNSRTDLSFLPENRNCWIENSHVPETWSLSDSHVLTGIPQNDWTLTLDSGLCLDVVPVGETKYCIRPYGMEDVFRGAIGAADSKWMGKTPMDWLLARGLTLADLELNPGTDLQKAPLFPVVDALDGDFVQWLIADVPTDHAAHRATYVSQRLSAEQISAQARLDRLYQQRKEFRQECLPLLARNHSQSIFYQLDLAALAKDYAETDHELPASLEAGFHDPIEQAHDQMFRAAVLRHRGDSDWKAHDRAAFSILRETLIDMAKNQPVTPQRKVLSDQIVWARSPIRLDLAGGWTDTPPYCMNYGGRVINVAVELNGQPPIQVYAKPLDRPEIVIRSIDQSYEERITRFEDLGNYDQLGASFAIPKAALALAGLLPDFSSNPQSTLALQLEQAGGGIELSLLAAVPKGSGLGTSSILAATVLGALSNFFELGWDRMEIGHRTLVLEQMLTSGGGWQDQYGGILPGIKYLETQPGLDQRPLVRWLPDHFLRHPDQRSCMLLYYTGITRVAQNILGEIVRGMFLNSSTHLPHVHQLYHHAQRTYEVVQGGDYDQLAAMIDRTWHLNQALDEGTNPPSVAAILEPVVPYLGGAKLLGAGGGGFLLMMAKDPEAAVNIRQQLTNNPPNDLARFVDFAISDTGLQVTRS